MIGRTRPNGSRQRQPGGGGDDASAAGAYEIRLIVHPGARTQGVRTAHTHTARFRSSVRLLGAHRAVMHMQALVLAVAGIVLTGSARGCSSGIDMAL